MPLQGQTRVLVALRQCTPQNRATTSLAWTVLPWHSEDAWVLLRSHADDGGEDLIAALWRDVGEHEWFPLCCHGIAWGVHSEEYRDIEVFGEEQKLFYLDHEVIAMVDVCLRLGLSWLFDVCIH